jgi:APA family basic amino acid/polyamine antiporter
MAVSLVMGNMIGSGIFLLPASLAPYGGLSLIGWLVSTAGALALAAVFARLSRLDPAAGGPYAYTRRAFGDLAGFLVAWGYWISIWTGIGALVVALTGYLTPFFPRLSNDPVAAAMVGVTALWAVIAVNVIGVRAAGRLQAVTTLLKLLPLAGIAVLGILHFDAAHFSIASSDGRSLVLSVPAVAALTLWAFLGLESATIPSGSIRDPDRTIPRATLTGTGLTAVIYIASTVGVMSALDPGALGQSAAPFADAGRALSGEWAARAVAGGAAVSVFGALNGWTLLCGQLPLAVARDGLFPQVFARISRRGTPAAAFVIGGILTTALVCLNYSRSLVDLFTFFILLATLNTLIPYAFCSLALFLLREGPRPARIGAGFAIVAALAFVYSLWAMAGAGQQTVYWGFLLMIAGLPVYVIVRSTGRGT